MIAKDAGKSVKPRLSVIVPVYNEEDGCDLFLARAEPVLNRIGLPYEIVFVNDGSEDNTINKLLEHRQRNPAIKIIDLSRNFGKEAALSAGLSCSQGDACVVIDADLQDPPELIEQFVAKWRESYDVVYGLRSSRRNDSLLKRMTAALFYRFFNSLSELPIPANAGDFRLMDRKVVEPLSQLPERDRFMKGLFAWVGYRQVGIPYSREKRARARTKWSYWKLWNFALSAIAAFSTVPLRVWSYCGILVSFLAFLYAGFLIVRTLVHGIDVPGYASLMVVVLFLGGIQLIGLGVIGEYLGRVYRETKHRPLFLAKKTYGFRQGGW